MASLPQTYTISDFIEWNKRGQLRLDPDFQRGSVWTASAKVFLIDTILRDLPMPQVYFRTKVDATTQVTVREVVDGQQRLRAILEFASGKLKLTSKAPAHKGMLYSGLTNDDKEQFLSYKLSVVQLINADNTNVLEVFARLNSYSVKVTPAELRHAEFNEPVKWAISDATREWSDLWNKYQIVSLRDSVRLKNTSTMAEMFMVIDQGFSDGGEPTITRYYKNRKSKGDDYFSPLREKINIVVDEIVQRTPAALSETTFYDAPNFLALFAAVAFLKGYAPKNRLTEKVDHRHATSVSWEKGLPILLSMASAVEDYDPENDGDFPYSSFVAATKSTTHRVSSRRPRFEAIVEALG